MLPLALARPRTDEEIVEQTNLIAGFALEHVIGTGYIVPADHKFYEAEDPRSQKAWAFACGLQELLFATDANDAVANLPEPEPRARYEVLPYQRDHGDTYVIVDTVRDGNVIARSIDNSPEAINELLGIVVTMNAAEEEGA